MLIPSTTEARVVCPHEQPRAWKNKDKRRWDKVMGDATTQTSEVHDASTQTEATADVVISEHGVNSTRCYVGDANWSPKTRF